MQGVTGREEEGRGDDMARWQMILGETVRCSGTGNRRELPKGSWQQDRRRRTRPGSRSQLLPTPWGHSLAPVEVLPGPPLSLPRWPRRSTPPAPAHGIPPAPEEPIHGVSPHLCSLRPHCSPQIPNPPLSHHSEEQPAPRTRGLWPHQLLPTPQNPLQPHTIAPVDSPPPNTPSRSHLPHGSPHPTGPSAPHLPPHPQGPPPTAPSAPRLPPPHRALCPTAAPPDSPLQLLPPPPTS